MILYIDYRESWFINKIRNVTNNAIDATAKMFNVTIGKVDVECMICNLEVGDFIIGNSLDSDIQLVIERKTYADLSSSITDGRFRQQKERLVSSTHDPGKVMYVLEGSKKSVSSRSAIINGAILNMILKHQFKVLATDSTNDTFDNIVAIYKKIVSGEMTTGPTTNPTSMTCPPVKLISKKEAVGNNIFATQLTAITGVSYKIALCITQKYKNGGELFGAYTSCEGIKENMLADIQVTNTRKLGKALSAKIYAAFFE